MTIGGAIGIVIFVLGGVAYIAFHARRYWVAYGPSAAERLVTMYPVRIASIPHGAWEGLSDESAITRLFRSTMGAESATTWIGVTSRGRLGIVAGEWGKLVCFARDELRVDVAGAAPSLAGTLEPAVRITITDRRGTRLDLELPHQALDAVHRWALEEPAP